MAEYQTLMHRWFEEVWNQGREEAIDEMLAEDVVGYGLPTDDGRPVRGAEQFKDLFRKLYGAFPNMKFTVGETVSDGEKISSVVHVAGRLEGDGMGVKANKQPVDFMGIVLIKTKDGKIVESWNAFDFLKMFSQIGAVTFNS